MTRIFYIVLSFILLSNYSFSQKGENNDSLLSKLVPVPNTAVSLIPPAHFKEVNRINGFIHPGSTASITVNEIEGTSYLQVTEGLTPEYFDGQGVELIGEEDVTTLWNESAKLYTVKFTVMPADSSTKPLEFERMMLFTGDYNKTIWINANYPVLIKPLLYGPMRQSILSVKLNETASQE